MQQQIQIDLFHRQNRKPLLKKLKLKTKIQVE